MIGERIENWIIEKPLGQGGMGNVYLARDPARAEAAHVAIKVLHAPLAQQAGFLERFDREIKALSGLDQENIVRFLSAGVHRGQPYYVMEYVEGRSLADLLADHGPLPWEEAVKIGIQVCKALQAAHQQEMIHRDLKPANLLLTNDGRVKLADFGIAKLFTEGQITLPETLVGTPDYVSPEQATGRPVTKRSDLYSLGVVLYQLLTGRLPFLAENASDVVHQHKFGTFEPPSKFVKDLPHELDGLIGELLAKDTEKRPGSAGIVADQLGRLQRKMVRKRDYTVDANRGPTRVDGPTATAITGAHDENARRFPEIARTESIPWGRLAVLSAMLAAVVFLIVWGIQPPAPEKLLAQAENAIAAGNWADGETALDKLDAKHPNHSLADRVAELRTQIESERKIARLRREAGAFAVTAPSCEAERLFRAGVLEYLAGNDDAARRIWTNLIAAFQDIPGQASWVKIAENALAEAAKGNTQLTAIRESLRRAESESPAAARKRLAALLEVYREQNSPEILPLLEEVKNRLSQLPSQ